MSERRNYYVYLHRRKTDNKVFYVGKGTSKRCYSKDGRNSYWLNTYKKHGLIVEIVFDNLTENEAFDLEKDTILEMRYHFGETLCNMTDGGEGVSGYKWVDLENHVSKRMIGRKQSAEEVEKRAAKLRGRKRASDVVKKIKYSIRKAKSGSIAFTYMKRFLMNRCIFVAKDFDRMPGINRKDFYVEPNKTNWKFNALAIERSRLARQGKPSWNADKSLYLFAHEDGTLFSGTIKDLSAKIDGKLSNVSRNIRKMLSGKNRTSAYGWRVIRSEE